LTVKSDDVAGDRIYEADREGELTLDPWLPESFNVS
jgi:DNA-directed RNA polymerase beta subunit